MKKSERIEIINKIINKIASKGRNFFRNSKDNDVAFIFEENGTLYMKNEYNKHKMDLKMNDNYPPKNWNHGGTIWGLTKDFIEYIETGEDTNHNNGYGGLYCTYWGYPKEDMLEIQELAKELGYLITKI